MGKPSVIEKSVMAREKIRGHTFTIYRLLKEADRIFNGDQPPKESEVKAFGWQVNKIIKAIEK